MSRKKKRKRNRAAKRGSAAAIQEHPTAGSGTLAGLPFPRKQLLDVATFQYVNRKGDRYYLHQGRTKTGKPKYFFSKKSAGELCSQLPDGFEIYESPRGQVHCRRILPKLITDQETEAVQEAIRQCGKQFFAAVDVKGKDLFVYEREERCLKFTLEDDSKRLFTASRWCFRGSIDGWLPLASGPKPLSKLARSCCAHIGEESFFELI